MDNLKCMDTKNTLRYISPINGRQIVIYGAGHDGRKAAEALDRLAIYPAFCVAKDGKRMVYGNKKEQPIFKPDILNKESHFVFIASRNHAQEMRENLGKLDFADERDYKGIIALCRRLELKSLSVHRDRLVINDQITEAWISEMLRFTQILADAGIEASDWEYVLDSDRVREVRERLCEIKTSAKEEN